KPIIESLQVTSLEPKSVHLTWKIGRSTKYPIEDQELMYFLEEKSKKNEKTIKLKGTKRSYKIHMLIPYSEYVVRLKVRNRFVSSDQKEISFTTATARPGPPGRPNVQFRDPTSVRVAWNTPKEANGKLVEYILEYSVANDSSSVKEIRMSATKTSLDVENLKRGMRYKFKVKATTSAGSGDFSKDYLFWMNFQAPSIPEPPNVTIPSANVYRLVWNKPNSAGNLVKVLVSLEWRIKHVGKIGQDEKEILVGKNVGSRTRRDITFDWQAEVTDYGSKRALDLMGLFPNTIYKVSIKEGWEGKGEILWSTETSKEIITPEGVPSQPRDLTVDMLSDASILLSWKRPLYIGGKLKKYIVFYGTDNDKKEKELKSGLENENATMVVDGLTSKKKYDMQVQAIGDKHGLMTNIVELKQGSGILKMSVDSQTKDSFTVSWRKPATPSIKIDDYRIYYRTVNGKWKSKNITSGLDNKTLSAKVTGLTSGELYQVKIQARSKRQVFLSEKQEVRSAIVQAREDDETNYVPMFGGIIAGVLIFAFVIIIVAMFVRYNYRKRQRNQRHSGQASRTTPNVLITRENGHTHMSSPSDHLSSDSPGSEKYLRPERKGNSVQVPLKVLSKSTKPIPVSNLLEYCTDHRQDGNKGFAEEFKSIDTGVKYSYEECKKPVNKPKNRYANIVTYDHTRVCLSNLRDNGSDYINANYVDGYNCQEKFIATQGPVASTFNDFWRMVWEQNCAAIVMVTNLIEKGKVKCQKYWPVTEAELFGSLTVNPIEEWELTDYTIRKFQLQQNNNSELTRDVAQFHYTAWPDHGVPVHPSRLLAFIRRVKSYSRVATGKILVHCSAGVGRTGTFIALDALLDQMKVEAVVDIYKFVSHMRTQRSLMVQTEAQYSFIYEAILEASICGDTEIPVPDYLEKLQTLEEDDQDEFLPKEFQNLNIVSVDEKETCVSGLIPENQKKNRCSSILPYDSNRVKLWPYPDEIGSDYINASFIDGYRNREIFIATQAPLKESVEDFWRMIWEYECYVLIMLLNEREDDEFQFLQYWPSRGEEYITFGLLMVEVESEEELDSYVQRILKCTNTKSGEVRRIYHVNYIGWVDHGVPVSASSLLNFVREVVKLEQRTGNGLTLVHCSDGSGRVGSFATIYIALERMKLENIIDLFSIVRNLRTQRIGMVENIEQYKFCYHALGEHIKSPNSQSY
ncbi:receptor-type tyrosine- phosphatase S-like isoform X10, partial [Paramuricea clavata]